MAEGTTKGGLGMWWVLIIIGGLLAFFYWKGRQISEQEEAEKKTKSKEGLTMDVFGGSCASLPPEMKIACMNAKAESVKKAASSIGKNLTVGVLQVQ